MKKTVIFCLALAIMSHMGMVDAFASSIDSRSIDVTVGEVDVISNDVEEHGITVPDTGLFGLEPRSASIVISVFFVMPMVAIAVWLSRYYIKKNKRKNKLIKPSSL